MKIVHIESGLGNQMLSYCEYLALRHLHPTENICIETIIYDIPACNAVIQQWNGYELDRVFGINVPNVREYCSPKEWMQVMQEVEKSKFWEKNWNYPVYITKALQGVGINVRNIRGNFEHPDAIHHINMQEDYTPTLRERIKDSHVGDWLRRISQTLREDYFIQRLNVSQHIFYSGTDDIFTGQWLGLKYRGNGMDRIAKQVHDTFRFPVLTDTRDLALSTEVQGCNSVAIHARRGDMLGANGYCYKYGYFRRAVAHIRRRVSDPQFYFFCDPGSIAWCKSNPHIFGLDFSRDKVHFVDWNTGLSSYRDMQLMSLCRHTIITNSSFGWWATFLNTYPDKITISPLQDIAVDTTVHV